MDFYLFLYLSLILCRCLSHLWLEIIKYSKWIRSPNPDHKHPDKNECIHCSSDVLLCPVPVTGCVVYLISILDDPDTTKNDKKSIKEVHIFILWR
mgnify:CR=1 FL=1